jgi:hypothetical protein
MAGASGGHAALGLNANQMQPNLEAYTHPAPPSCPLPYPPKTSPVTSLPWKHAWSQHLPLSSLLLMHAGPVTLDYSLHPSLSPWHASDVL